MRGTPSLCEEADGAVGIIPAHAGNTREHRPRKASRRDHPRACGEHTLISHDIPTYAGSSPRMRGTRASRRNTGRHAGIIPAHAGNTFYILLDSRESRDHPRACGEHGKMASLPKGAVGSSPRMRGTPYGNDSCHPQAGIIPAHAGNTRNTGFSSRTCRDHPRACGEHRLKRTKKFNEKGSSPRMRGTQSYSVSKLNERGIIPAHAGNTCADFCCADAHRDHPRACGEHTTALNVRVILQGSSPRMRGTRRTGASPKQHGGIIPAHAGNTGFDREIYRRGRDHPRACGEHSAVNSPPLVSSGSSPRMRGTHTAREKFGKFPGIIPAHAGNTM